MKRTLFVALAAVLVASLAAADADAKRLGGGRSLGAQRQSVPPPSSATGPAANPVMPAQPGVATAKPAAPAVAPSGASRWLGPIAGIAAGLGLAALLSHFGLPEGFASFLLLGLLAFGAIVAFRMFAARRGTAAPTASYSGLATAAPRPVIDATPSRVEPVLAAPSTNFAKPLPAGFDTAGFLREAKNQFRRLQTAWDEGDSKALAEVMTPEMAAEIGRDLDLRGTHHVTEIVSLDAEMMDVTTEAGAHWASVRFTGLAREDDAPQPTSLDEIWNLTKPVDGSSGWLLAGIRQTA